MKLFKKVIGLLFLVAACATVGTTASETAHVVVENQAFHDANVYVMCGSGQRRVFRQVVGLATSRPLTFRMCPSSELWFRVELIGSKQARRTPVIPNVRPDDTVWLTIPMRFNTLWYMVR